VVAKFVRLMRAGEPVTIFGDGRQTRDFIHVDDVVQAIRLALTRPHDEPIFQIATGRETSVIELVERLGRCAGESPRVEWLPPAAGEIRRNSSSIELARRRLGFEPAVSLDHGLPRTWEWLASELRDRAAASPPH
jgi:UDP-glucose 4-epimerase